MRQLQLWQDDPLAMPPHRQDGDDPKLDPCYESLIPLAEVTLLQRDDAAVGASSEWVAGPPRAVPLPTAVEAGVFGGDTNGPFMPDAEEVEALTGEHANEMIVLLSDWQAVEHAQRFGYDPATRRVPTTQEQRDFLSARLDTEHKRLAAAYTDAVAAYAEGFGDAAASSLDEWVRKTVADGEPQWEPYPPSHPWHYYHAGDNASPMPVGQIEPDPQAGQWLEQRLPKNPAKRMQVLREMLEKEQASLAADQERYKEIVERGAEALSRFDREIAHTSDAMAVATALALKYTHISQGKGRVKWLSAGT